MTRRFSSLLACAMFAFALLTFFSPTAQAEEDDKTRAAALKQHGDSAMLDLRYGDALSAYDQAFELDPNPVFRYNRGRALQALDRFPEALDELEAFRRDAPDDLKARVPGLAELVANVRAKVATVNVTSEPEGARVLIRDKRMGVTPFAAPLRVNAGKATVEVVKEGYLPFKTKILLPGGETTQVTAELVPRGNTGVLIVKAQAGAIVHVDGREIGSVPAEAKLKAGEHQVRVVLAGHEDAVSTAVVVAGKRKQLDIELVADTPLHKQWWLWTGLGVLVAAGVVVAAVVTATAPADDGDIAPGQVEVGTVSIFTW